MTLSPWPAKRGTPNVPGRHQTQYGCRACGSSRATRRGLCAACRAVAADRCATCQHPRAWHPAVPRRPAYVTLRLLRDHGACDAAALVFERWWGRGVTVTPAVARFAQQLGLPLRWAADRLVTSRAARVHLEHRLAELTPRLGAKWALRRALVEALAVEHANRRRP